MSFVGAASAATGDCQFAGFSSRPQRPVAAISAPAKAVAAEAAPTTRHLARARVKVRTSQGAMGNDHHVLVALVSVCQGRDDLMK